MDKIANKKPTLILGGSHIDDRGVLSFVNEFDLTPIKRFYTITHPNAEVVRAWQGHQQEHKFFHVLKGSFVVAWVEIDNWESPSQDLKAEHVILKANEPSILTLPPGCANGLKALEANSQIMVYSDYLLNESGDDEFRFDKDWWFDWDQFK